MLSGFITGVILTRAFLNIIHAARIKPRRSPSAVALFQGGWALQQVWLFWVMPIIGGVLGGVIYRTLLEKHS